MTTIQTKQPLRVSNNPLYLDYHDHEWGIPIYDDRLLFELLILEACKLVLSWLTILKNVNIFVTVLISLMLQNSALLV